MLLLCSQVLREIDNATKAFPNAYIRMCAFDANRQVQVASMLVHRPASAKEWRPVNQRQVGNRTRLLGRGCHSSLYPCCVSLHACQAGAAVHQLRCHCGTAVLSSWL